MEVTFSSNPSVLLSSIQFFHTLVNRNNADLGKGVPRQHVFHEAWELLFFSFFAACDALSSARNTDSALPTSKYPYRKPDPAVQVVVLRHR